MILTDKITAMIFDDGSKLVLKGNKGGCISEDKNAPASEWESIDISIVSKDGNENLVASFDHELGKPLIMYAYNEEDENYVFKMPVH